MKKDRSTVTSLVTVFLLGACLLALAFTAPWLTKLFIEAFDRPSTVFTPIIATFYCILPFAAGVLCCLGMLLSNIAHEKVFIKQNISLLRAMSILLFVATLIFVAAGCFYMPFFLLALCAAFITLIVRVVKNCFAAAVILKDENELTI